MVVPRQVACPDPAAVAVPVIVTTTVDPAAPTVGNHTIATSTVTFAGANTNNNVPPNSTLFIVGTAVRTRLLACPNPAAAAVAVNANPTVVAAGTAVTPCQSPARGE